MGMYDGEVDAVPRKRNYRCKPGEYGLDTGTDSYVQEAAKDECDINNIMKRYEKTGIITHVNKYEGQYGDFTDVVDYRTACDIVRQADEMFESLPASVRTRFDNDPDTFLRFVDDPANGQALVDLGLARVRDPDAADRIVSAIRESSGSSAGIDPSSS